MRVVAAFGDTHATVIFENDKENRPFDLHSSREIHILNAPQLINFLAREGQFRTFLQSAYTTHC